MHKLKSAKFWVSNVIISLGISLVMGIFAPLVQGLGFSSISLILALTLYNGVISGLIGAFIPLQAISVFIYNLFSKKENRFVVGLIFNIILTAILSFTTAIYIGQLNYEQFIRVLKVFLWLVSIAYLAETLFVFIANKVTKNLK